jgi:hypothetical protein
MKLIYQFVAVMYIRPCKHFCVCLRATIMMRNVFNAIYLDIAYLFIQLLVNFDRGHDIVVLGNDCHLGLLVSLLAL